MKATAVIGANFGDEGKGRTVDHFAGLSPSIVVRYNGGAQAGHTVVRNGVEHVFQHFGAGTLAGSPTYLSAFFIANPFLWKQELKDLDTLGVKPTLYANKYCPLTTPFDMLINREVERVRGVGRHGSCGLGINETVERLCNSKNRLFIEDIEKPDFADMLMKVKAEWVPKRLAALGITKTSDWFDSASSKAGFIEEYIADAKAMIASMSLMDDPDLKRWDHVIFEGAQGLCLDERHMFFPHVTRSRTGLPNIIEICGGAGIEELDVVYVTRAYLTRHGAGPLPTENPSMSFDDPTNNENEFQGKLRFGNLDADLLRSNIMDDLENAGDVNVRPSLAMTCLDQVNDPCLVIRGKMQATDDLAGVVGDHLGFDHVYASRSRSATEAVATA